MRIHARCRISIRHSGFQTSTGFPTGLMRLVAVMPCAARTTGRSRQSAAPGPEGRKIGSRGCQPPDQPKEDPDPRCRRPARSRRRSALHIDSREVRVHWRAAFRSSNLHRSSSRHPRSGSPVLGTQPALLTSNLLRRAIGPHLLCCARSESSTYCSSTPAGSSRRAPCIYSPLVAPRDGRGEKCGLAPPGTVKRYHHLARISHEKAGKSRGLVA